MTNRPLTSKVTSDISSLLKPPNMLSLNGFDGAKLVGCSVCLFVLN